MSVANASPVGTDFAGAKLGYPVPSDFILDSDGVHRKSLEVASLKGISTLQTCGNYVDRITFFYLLQDMGKNRKLDLVGIDNAIKGLQISLIYDDWKLDNREEGDYYQTGIVYSDLWIKDNRQKLFSLMQLGNELVLVLEEKVDTPCVSRL